MSPPTPPAPPVRFTGADLYALCSDAWMTALKRAIAQQDEEGQPESRAASNGDSSEGGTVLVNQADFLEAADSVQPSLSIEEVAKYERIRDEYHSK